MRITGGEARGRRIHAPRIESVRPTPDMIREALFHILPSMDGLKFLDLFAGCGIVGMEALSRGAARTVFIEENKRTAMAISGNLQRCGWDKKGDILTMTVERGLHSVEVKGEKFHIIFSDPPYEKGWVGRTLQGISQSTVCEERALIVFQHSIREEIAEESVGEFVSCDRRVYGDTIITILKSENL
ncbi:MAG: 16S rRNA (guanine(966)-N(2))-methyltransferase RsmD [Syntrophales bacterium]